MNQITKITGQENINKFLGTDSLSAKELISLTDHNYIYVAMYMDPSFRYIFSNQIFVHYGFQGKFYIAIYKTKTIWEVIL